MRAMRRDACDAPCRVVVQPQQLRPLAIVDAVRMTSRVILDSQYDRTVHLRYTTPANIQPIYEVYCVNVMTMSTFTNNGSILLLLFGWRRGVVVSGVRRMNEVNARLARLVLGRVTVFGRVYHLGM